MTIRRVLAALPILAVACVSGRQAVLMGGDDASAMGGDSTSAALGGMICAGLALVAAGVGLLIMVRGDFLKLLSRADPGPRVYRGVESERDEPLFD